MSSDEEVTEVTGSISGERNGEGYVVGGAMPLVACAAEPLQDMPAYKVALDSSLAECKLTIVSIDTHHDSTHCGRGHDGEGVVTGNSTLHKRSERGVATTCNSFSSLVFTNTTPRPSVVKGPPPHLAASSSSPLAAPSSSPLSPPSGLVLPLKSTGQSSLPSTLGGILPVLCGPLNVMPPAQPLRPNYLLIPAPSMGVQGLNSTFPFNPCVVMGMQGDMLVNTPQQLSPQIRGGMSQRGLAQTSGSQQQNPPGFMVPLKDNGRSFADDAVPRNSKRQRDSSTAESADAVKTPKLSTSLPVVLSGAVPTQHIRDVTTNQNHPRWSGDVSSASSSDDKEDTPSVGVASEPGRYVVFWLSACTRDAVEPPNSGHHPFVLCREVVLFLYRVCIREYKWCVLCWEVCPLSECPLSEVSL